MAPLADAFVQVRPDTNGFSAELKGQLAKSKETVDVVAKLSAAEFQRSFDLLKKDLKSIQVTKAAITADSAAAAAKIKTLKAELVGLNTQVEVDGSTDDLTEKIVAVKAELASITDTKARLSLDSSEANKTLASLNARLAVFGAAETDHTVNLEVNGPGGRGDGDVSFDWGAIMGTYKIPAVVTALSVLATATAAVGAAAVGAVASAAPLTGLFAAYPSVMLAAGQATGTVTFALEGLAEAVEVLNDPDASPEEVAKAMEALTPAARKLATSVAELVGGPLKDLKLSLQEAIAPGFAQAIKNITPLFPVLEKQMSGTARVIGNLAAEATGVMNTPFFKGQLSRIMENNNKVIANGGKAGIALGQALLDIVDAFRPVLLAMSEYAVRGAQFIQATVRAGLESGKLGDFFKRSWELAKDFGSVIADLAVGLFNVGSQSQSMGKFIGGGIAEGAAAFRAWTESVSGKNSIKQYFADSIPIVREVVSLVGAAVVGFSSLASNPTLVPLIEQIRTQLLPALMALANGVTTAFGPALISAATAFIQFNNVLSFSPLATVLQIMADTVIFLTNAIAKAPAPLNMILSTILALGVGLKVTTYAMSSMAGLFGPLVTGWTAVATAEGRATLATKLQVVWSKISAAALKAQAVAMWLLNVAMRANPIVLVVTVLAALGAAMVVAYKKSETFRAIVHKTWDVIKQVTGSTWDFIKGVFDKLKDALRVVGDAWQKVRDVIKDVWDRIKDTVKNAVDAVKDAMTKAWDVIRDKTRALWDGIKDTIGNAWDNIKNVVKNASDAVRTQIGNAWDAVRTGTSTAWGKVKEVIANAWDGIKKALGGVGEFLRNNVVDAFRTAVAAIKTVWDKLKGIAVAPVNFVIKWVYNQGIRDLVNTVSDALKLGIELPAVPLIKFAKGGVVPGRDTGKDYVPAMMRGGEGVLVPETVRKLGGAYGIERLNKWGKRISGGTDHGGAGAGPGRPSTEGVGVLGDWVGKIKNIIAKLGDIGGSPYADMVKGSARAVVDGVKDWISEKAKEIFANFISKGGWTQPMKKGSYGLTTGYSSGHPGVDLDIPNGPPYENVYASHSGRVHFAGWGGADSYGNYVQLRHGLMGGGRGGHGSREMHTLYAHLNSIVAKAGAEVTAGDVIGHAGTTGNSSGDHLHFETRWNGAYATQSPLTFMAAMGAPLFDGGGKWKPGLGMNLSGQTEAVLDPRASRAYERVGDFLANAGNQPAPRSSPYMTFGDIHVTDLDEWMRRQRREQQRAAVMATT